MTRPPRVLSRETAALLVLDTEPWLSCEDCFELMDRYVEAVLEHAETPADPPADPVPGMREHLAGCPACAEEVDSLRELLAAD